MILLNSSPEGLANTPRTSTQKNISSICAAHKETVSDKIICAV